MKTVIFYNNIKDLKAAAQADITEDTIIGDVQAYNCDCGEAFAQRIEAVNSMETFAIHVLCRACEANQE